MWGGGARFGRGSCGSELGSPAAAAHDLRFRVPAADAAVQSGGGCGVRWGPGRGPRGLWSFEESPTRAVGAQVAAGAKEPGGRERSLNGHCGPRMGILS